MSTSISHRPMGNLDANARVIPSTFDDLAYQGDLGGGANLVYEAWARPGTATSALGWKICKHTYSGSTRVTTTWPQNSLNKASADYEFEYDERANYTYS